jgi:hypothetical protein
VNRHANNPNSVANQKKKEEEYCFDLKMMPRSRTNDVQVSNKTTQECHVTLMRMKVDGTIMKPFVRRTAHCKQGSAFLDKK